VEQEKQRQFKESVVERLFLYSCCGQRGNYQLAWTRSWWHGRRCRRRTTWL